MVHLEQQRHGYVNRRPVGRRRLLFKAKIPPVSNLYSPGDRRRCGLFHETDLSLHLDSVCRLSVILPSGVKEITGEFKHGDVVYINNQFKAVTNLSSTELLSVMGKHSSEIQKILGSDIRDDVARPEDIVPL